MNKVLTLKARTSDGIADEINKLITFVGAAEMRVISIVKDGRGFVAFVNVELTTTQMQALEGK